MRICFFSEYKNIVGGITSLYINLIVELRKRNVEVVLFNYEDGLIARELQGYNTEVTIVNIDTFNWNEVGKIISSKDVFIVIGFSEFYHKFFNVNPKLLFYNIADYLCDISKYKFGLNPKILAIGLIKQLMQKHALMFMDDIGVRGAATRLSLIIKDPKFLPLPVTMPSENLYLRKVSDIKNKIRFTYIGRSIDWKMYPLKKILLDLSSCDQKYLKEIEFRIVVDDLAALRKYIDIDLFCHQNSFKISLFENIRPSEINKFLLDHSDINFGMGTSALDSGKLGIPTILMDFNKKDLPENFQYTWLYNTQFYRLGEQVKKNYYAPPNSFLLNDLLTKICSENNFINEQSVQTYDYVKNNHGVESAVDTLLGYAAKTTFHFKSSQRYILYYSRFHRLAKRFKSLQ